MADEDEKLDNEDLNPDENDEGQEGSDDGSAFGDKVVDENIIPVGGLYENWFLDYASYVILERAVPSLYDGFKPVQRRIMHSMKEMDDGRYNKVANIIGNTMKYHPHGDASIGDALVNLGQKDLLIDCQGNWGNTLTGDSAAAPRYIEARVSKFAQHVVFNPKTTNWLKSYDGRNDEPDQLPVKFPLLLAQGAEGIAVGMACKIMPHNFVELIEQSINHLRGKGVKIYPDFPNGGMIDVSNYNDGLRGGKIRVRAKIKKESNKLLVVTEVPYGTTTSLIESILKANDKGKIKIKKIEDNTAATAEVMIHLAAGVSPDKTLDALYAFTDCEVSISPNSSVIDGDKPRFMGASQILKVNTDTTVELLKRELEIRLKELEQQWHMSTLEKIFINEEMYIEFKEYSDRENLYGYLYKRFKPFKKQLIREIVDEDLERLTRIPMIRITRFDKDKADEQIAKIEAEMGVVKENLANLIDYAIDYYKDLKKRFGEGKERKCEIKTFDSINANKVIIANRKFYVDYEEGFIGYGLKKAEYIADCSEIDDVIVFFSTGKMLVTKISDKKFVGKGIIYANVWKRGDTRTVYHMMYQDGKGGSTMMKRFNVKSITRDTEYDLTRGTKGSKLLYFNVHKNGEREVVTVVLRARPHLKRLKFDVDLGDLLIKGRGAGGNRVTKEIVSKIVQKEVGGSTLAARKIWYDDVVGRLNDEGRGKFLGQFKGEDKILTLYKTGEYRLSGFDLATHFDDDMMHIEKWHPDRPISTVYYDADKELHYGKKFLCEVTSDKKVSFISEGEGSTMDAVSTAFKPRFRVVYNKLLKATKNLPDTILEFEEFIDVKGMKAQGNQVTKLKVKEIILDHAIEGDEPWPEVEKEEVKPEAMEQTEEIEGAEDEKPQKMEWDVSKDEEEDPNQEKLF
ncbi:DNA gyrase/topoisomerase IV subunit A [Crocinitomicaceae bacterium]|nr:DNA gyrase/topoisomerase IV subunit A [Crocinitomicaceae bacterium]MDC0257451.1 DNA gyrase/topoisomerase IV subunit A [Crocinitomicaceae bacterium]